MPTLANHAHLSDPQALRLVHEIKVLETLEEVLHWGLAQEVPRIVLDVIVQDEYCHDVVMEWEGGLHLVFDTT